MAVLICTRSSELKVLSGVLINLGVREERGLSPRTEGEPVRGQIGAERERERAKEGIGVERERERGTPPLPVNAFAAGCNRRTN